MFQLYRSSTKPCMLNCQRCNQKHNLFEQENSHYEPQPEEVPHPQSCANSNSPQKIDQLGNVPYEKKNRVYRMSRVWRFEGVSSALYAVIHQPWRLSQGCRFPSADSIPNIHRQLLTIPSTSVDVVSSAICSA